MRDNLSRQCGSGSLPIRIRVLDIFAVGIIRGFLEAAATRVVSSVDSVSVVLVSMIPRLHRFHCCRYSCLYSTLWASNCVNLRTLLETQAMNGKEGTDAAEFDTKE